MYYTIRQNYIKLDIILDNITIYLCMLQLISKLNLLFNKYQ